MRPTDHARVGKARVCRRRLPKVLEPTSRQVDSPRLYLTQGTIKRTSAIVNDVRRTWGEAALVSSARVVEQIELARNRAVLDVQGIPPVGEFSLFGLVGSCARD